MSTKSKIIVILGQTASGKSELAVKLAKKFNSEIISADSRQVYKGLDIGAGKVSRDKNSKFEILNSKQIQNFKSQIQEKPYFHKGIRHYLLDVASPKRIFTVSQYQKLAQKVIQKILKKGKVPIICGGTGLYIDAVVYDWKLPEIPPQPKLRKELEKFSTEKLFKKLQKLDPRRAKNIDKNNRRRLIRALEIVLTTGRQVPAAIRTDSKSNFNILMIGIKKSPEELKGLIKKRLLKRLKQGMIEEVKNLYEKQKISWQRLDDLGLEYRYISRYLRGLIGKKEMIEILNREIYKYAKRQMTWFKRNKDIYWIIKIEEAMKLAKDFLSK